MKAACLLFCLLILLLCCATTAGSFDIASLGNDLRRVEAEK